MHRAWCIAEVVDMIIAFSEGKGTLARLARTHSSFFEPAASRLWKSVDAGHILRLFAIAEERTTNANTTNYLDRYDTYFQSVLSLKLWTFYSGNFPALMDIANALSLGGHHILPNIRSLGVDLGFEDTSLETITSMLITARLFMSDTITDLVVDLDHTRDDENSQAEDVKENRILDFLRMVKISSPNLLSLTISRIQAPVTTIRFLETVGEVISGLGKLERFEGSLWVLTEPVFSALGTLPFLETLIVTREDEAEPLEDARTSPTDVGKVMKPGAFPRLEFLQLEGLADVVNRCLRACSEACNVGTLVLKTTGDSLLLQVATTIGTVFPHLQSLDWSDESDPSPPSDNCNEILTALAPCRGLTQLTLHICDHESDGRDGTETMTLSPIGLAWPELRKLHLCSKHRFTFDEVAAFADQCYLIRSVSLGLRKETEICIPRDIVPSPRKVEFCISTHMESPAPQVALFLYTLWPKLVFHEEPWVPYITFDDENEVAMMKSWESVITCIKALRTSAAIQKGWREEARDAR